MKARLGVRFVVGFAVVVAATAVAACRSGPPPIREFMLSASSTATSEPNGSPTTDSSTSTDGAHAMAKLPAVRVMSLEPRAFLDRRGIAWREGDVRSGAYQYRRWSEAPADAATRALVDALRARGAFEQVDATGDPLARAVTIRGELLGLHESSDENGDHPTGVAELELVVDVAPKETAADGSAASSRGATRTILHSRHEVAAADESMEALVRAISEALRQVIDELVPQVEAAAKAR